MTDAERAFSFRELCPEAGCAYSRTATAELSRQVWSGLGPRWQLQEQRVDSGELVTTNLLLDLPRAVPSSEGVLAVKVVRLWGRYDGARRALDGRAELVPPRVPEPDYRNPCPQYQDELIR